MIYMLATSCSTLKALTVTFHHLGGGKSPTQLFRLRQKCLPQTLLLRSQKFEMITPFLPSQQLSTLQNPLVLQHITLAIIERTTHPRHCPSPRHCHSPHLPQLRWVQVRCHDLRPYMNHK